MSSNGDRRATDVGGRPIKSRIYGINQSIGDVSFGFAKVPVVKSIF